MSGSEHGIAHEGAEGRYDPELPFLHALERDVRRHARHVAASRRPEHSLRKHRSGQDVSQSGQDISRFEHATHTQRRRLRPDGARVTRRSLTLLALLSLIGASAFGAGRIFSGASTPNPAAVHQSAFVTLATGTGSERWSLRVYTRGSELCRVLAVGETESSRCSPAIGSRALGATSALSSNRRYLFGIARASVAAVAVRSGAGTVALVPTHTLPAIAAKIAHVPFGERWYVIVLARPVGEPDPPLRVQGLDRGGQPIIGAVVVDCPETVEPRGCAAR